MVKNTLPWQLPWQARRAFGQKSNTKLQRRLTQQVKFIVIIQNKTVSCIFPAKKDKIPEFNRSNVIWLLKNIHWYDITKFTDKTDRTYAPTNTNRNHNSAFSEHLTKCEHSKQSLRPPQRHATLTNLSPTFKSLLTILKYFILFWKHFLLNLRCHSSTMI